MTTYSSNPMICEVEAERSGVLDQPQSLNKPETAWATGRACLKEHKNK